MKTVKTAFNNITYPSKTAALCTLFTRMSKTKNNAFGGVDSLYTAAKKVNAPYHLTKTVYTKMVSAERINDFLNIRG